MVSTTDQRRLEELLVEQRRRQNLALRIYRPRAGSQEEFHRSLASERLVRGGVRGGKTVCAATETGSAATGIPLTDSRGREIPHKFPTNRPLLIWVIGFDEGHISVMYKKLFAPGLFKIITDKATGQWRAWRPWDPDDAARENETKQSPPIIPGGPDCDPKGLIAEWAWSNKAGRVFDLCRLKNGTEIRAFTSGGAAGQGEAVDLIWIDEDIKYPEHIAEWQSRLSDVRGRLIWSAWPHSDNEAIKNITMRAQEQRDRKEPDVAEWVLPFDANPYVPAEEKRKRLEGWGAISEAVLRARNLGEYTDDYQLVYPTFNNDVHGMPRKAGPDAVELYLQPLAFHVPNDWTRYLAVDPGHTNAAVLFAAVPPPSIGNFLVIYDEILAQRLEPTIIAEMIRDKTPANAIYRAFMIDWHAGRQTESGSGKRTVEFWREAFASFGIRSQLTDTGFLPGSDDIGARNMVIRNWMLPRPDGTTHLRIISERCPHTRREFQLYKKKITRDDVSEDVKRKDNHLMDALGYLGAYLAPLFDYNSAYVVPFQEQQVDKTMSAYHELQKRLGVKRSDGSFYFGAGVVPNAA